MTASSIPSSLNDSSSLTSSRVIFFDLDRTILDVNSANLWVKREWKTGHLSTWNLLRAAGLLLQYHWGRADLEQAFLSSIHLLKGQKEQDLEDRTFDFYQKEIQHRIRPEVLDTLHRHRQQGDLCVLLTSSSIYMSRLVQNQLGFDDILCTQFEVKHGIFTGLPQGETAFGPGKVTLAQNYVLANKIKLQECWMYTDSYSDLPILEAVGFPQVVCPDRRLQKHAQKMNWPILWWSTAENK